MDGKLKRLFNMGILVVLSLIMLLYWQLSSEPVETEGETNREIERVAQVETVKLQKGNMQETITAYGMVLPFPDKLKTFNVPYISLVDKIQVSQGQRVQQGDALLTLKPGAEALLQFGQAQRELEAAIRENQLVQAQLKLKLATQQSLIASRLRVEQAKVMLKNLSDRGIGVQQLLTAEEAGIIYLVNVQQGQIVSAGAPLLQIVGQNQWGVRLGIEPEDYSHLRLNQVVLMTPVNTPVTEPVKGHIEMITQQIDPVTRLLNVFVRPELNQTLLINDFVEAKIIVSVVNTFFVPRQAVLPDDGDYSLFTIENGYAIKHNVQIGLENERYFEVLSDDLKEQDEVVLLGNYELEHDMKVVVLAHHSMPGIMQ